MLPLFTFFLGLFIYSLWVRFSLTSTKERSKLLIEEALEKRDLIFQELKEERKKKEEEEKAQSLSWKEHLIDLRRQEKLLQQKEEEVIRRQKQLEQDYLKLKSQEELALQKLSSLAGSTPEEALCELKKSFQNELALYKEEALASMRQEMKREGQKILCTVLQRFAPTYAKNHLTNHIPYPKPELKGRLVGREGRNIRLLEQLTQTTIRVDELPESVTISSFDPLRKELATAVIQELFTRGRIYPSVIEEVVEQKQHSQDEQVLKEGQLALLKSGTPHLHIELIKLLGKLHFRYSLGQNLLEHSIEVACMMELMAEELGLNSHLAKRIGLLHDIGKAISHEKGKSHAIVGMEKAKQYGEREEVVNGIGAHHHEVAPSTLEATLCQAADTLSAARPGARLHHLENTFQRVKAVEEAILEITGVEKAYALKTGKEIQILLSPNHIKKKQLSAFLQTVRTTLSAQGLNPLKTRLTVSYEEKLLDDFML